MALYKDKKLIFNLKLIPNYFSIEKINAYFKNSKNIGSELFNEV